MKLSLCLCFLLGYFANIECYIETDDGPLPSPGACIETYDDTDIEYFRGAKLRIRKPKKIENDEVIKTEDPKTAEMENDQMPRAEDPKAAEAETDQMAQLESLLETVCVKEKRMPFFKKEDIYEEMLCRIGE